VNRKIIIFVRTNTSAYDEECRPLSETARLPDRREEAQLETLHGFSSCDIEAMASLLQTGLNFDYQKDLLTSKRRAGTRKLERASRTRAKSPSGGHTGLQPAPATD